MSRRAQHKKRSAAARTASRAGAGGLATLSLMMAAPGIASADINDPTWGPIAECESGNRNVENGSSSASGYWQIIDGTWRGAGGQEFAPRAIDATREQQLIVAERIRAARGSFADWNASRSCWEPMLATTPAPPPPPPAPAPEPPPVAEAPPVEPATTEIPVVEQSGGHVVQAGDTLTDIAAAYGTTWRELANLNGIVEPYVIRPGDMLQLPQALAVTHEVIPGDTLSEIAVEESIPTWEELYEQNRDVVGDDPHFILPGQVLTYVGGLILPAPPVAIVEEPPAPPAVAEEPPPAAPPEDDGSELSISGSARPADGNVTAEFGDGRNHAGMDFDGIIGDRVLAAADGVVQRADLGTHDFGSNGGWGGVIDVVASDGTLYRYAHLSGIRIAKGDFVAAGQRIGDIGNTGHVISSTGDGSHLHFGIYDPSLGAINPRPWLEQRGLL